MRDPRKEGARRRPRREPYDRVLIVCEGEKTEPNYFSELVRYHRLSTANIEIEGEGSDPLSIVRKGMILQQKERRTGEKYDRVYCVFDRDEHARFQEASRLAEQSGLCLSRSWPCFEFWLLLHFHYSRRPYVRSRNGSPADNCIRDLRRHWPEYRKAGDGVFLHLRPALEDARERADRARADARQTDEDNPSTEVHGLVEYLEGLKNSSR